MKNVNERVSVESLAEEYLERKQRGESPAISEYKAKYPDLADEIEDIFPAMELMEDFKPASGDLSDESASSRPAVPVLRQVADYRILREIGRGGMGVVYEAEQQSLGRRVALKVLPESSVGGTKMLDRFQREARAAAKMHHTNIVPVFEVGQDEQCAFYAMQLIQGQGLDAVIGDLRDLRIAHTGNGEADSVKQDGQVAGGKNSLAHSLMTGHFDCENYQLSLSSEIRNPTCERGTGEPSSPGSLAHAAGYEGTSDRSDDPALIETTVAAVGSTVSASLPGEGDLSTAEDNRRSYFRSVAEIGHQCAEALSYAHARGIIHRDIKPSNLLLDTNGVVWVTDFGLAKTGDVGLTQTGDILGTIRYMSPERFKGQCDNRADVYSLGLTLYEMLVLKPAYESPDRLKLIDIVTNTEIIAPRSIDSRVPRDLETIVLKACDKDPRRRYQSSDDMADDIQRFLKDEPILARRVSPTERVARWSRRNPWLATAMSVASAALITIAGISIVAAQTQSKLNEQLTDANQEQNELNAALNEKTDEQRKTVLKLVESNQSKEELIRDLKKSQSRLAEKQAEYVEEKGNLAESMLWLARSYQLADDQTTEFRRNLLNKLEASAARMPRLVGADNVGGITADSAPLFTEELRERMRNASVEERRSIAREVISSRAFPRIRATSTMSDDQTLIAFPVLRSEKAEANASSRIASIRVWDVRAREWTGKTIEPGSPVVKLAVDSHNRLIAGFLLDSAGEIAPRSSGQRLPLGTLTLAVWSLDSGEQLWELDVASSVQVRGLIRRPLQFRDAGKEVVAVTDTVAALEGVPVTVYDSNDGEIIREARIAPAPGSSFTTHISPDGRRLIIVTSPRPVGAGRFNKISCFEIDTGDQVGETLESESVASFGRGNLQPTILTPNGSRIAVFSGGGRNERIEILDFESSTMVGRGIDIPRQANSRTVKLNANPAGTQLAVWVPSQRYVTSRQETPGLMHVIDVDSGESIAPPVPVSGAVSLVAMPEKRDDLTIVQNKKIHTWQLPHSPMQRVLIPWQGMSQNRASPFGPGLAATVAFSTRMNSAQRIARGIQSESSTNASSTLNAPSIELAINRRGNILTAERDPSGISLRTWDRESGRLLSQKKLAESSSHFVGMFSPGGEFLMTGHVGEGPDAAAYYQLWQTSTATRLGEPLESKGLVFDEVLLAVSPDGSSVLLRRRQNLASPDEDSLEAPPGGRFSGGSRTRYRLQLLVVHLATGQETELPNLVRTNGHFSGDGRSLYVTSPTRQWRYDLQAGTFDPPLAPTDVGSPPALFNRSPGLAAGNGRGSSSSPGRGSFRGLPANTGVGAQSSDGTLTAHVVDDSVVQIRPAGRGDQLGDEEPHLVELPHPSPVYRVAFDPESKLAVTAATDGLIRLWTLPQRWSGTAEEIDRRVQQHAGIAFGESDQVVIANPFAAADESTNDTQPATNGSDSVAGIAVPFLSGDEIDAIRLRNERRWEEAAVALSQWASLRPDDWLPLALGLRPLVELRRFEEADIAWTELTERLGRESAFAWLQADHDALSRLASTNDPSDDARHNRFNSRSAPIHGWYHRHLLEFAPDDETRAAWFLKAAKVHEAQFEFNEAAEAINQAVALDNESADMHYYRAHLMERLSRWDEARESCEAYARMKPDSKLARYRMVCSYLFANDLKTARTRWDEFAKHHEDALTAKDDDAFVRGFSRRQRGPQTDTTACE